MTDDELRTLLEDTTLELQNQKRLSEGYARALKKLVDAGAKALKSKEARAAFEDQLKDAKKIVYPGE